MANVAQWSIEHMEDLIRCRTCGKEFDPRTKRKMRGGFIDQCIKCSKGDVAMYLGRPGKSNKGGDIEIFRENLKFVKSILTKEKGAGFNANLIISSPKAVPPEDREEKGGDE